MTKRNTLLFPWCGRIRRWRLRTGSDGRCRCVVVAMVAWCRVGGVVIDGEPVAATVRHSEAFRRSQPSLSISLGFEVGNGGGSDKPRTPSCQSPPPLYRAARRGPTSLFLSWAPLIRARVKGPNMAIGPSLVEINITCAGFNHQGNFVHVVLPTTE